MISGVFYGNLITQFSTTDPRPHTGDGAQVTLFSLLQTLLAGNTSLTTSENSLSTGYPPANPPARWIEQEKLTKPTRAG